MSSSGQPSGGFFLAHTHPSSDLPFYVFPDGVPLPKKKGKREKVRHMVSSLIPGGNRVRHRGAA